MNPPRGLPRGGFNVLREAVDFGLGQGRREFGTAGVAALRRGSQLLENEDLGQKMPPHTEHLSPVISCLNTSMPFFMAQKSPHMVHVFVFSGNLL